MLLATRSGLSEAKRNLEFLNVSIRARIEDFDNFYNTHFQDFRMPFFEKQKYRLRRYQICPYFRLLVEALTVDPDFEEGEELQILTDQELEAARHGTMQQTYNYFGNSKKSKKPALFDSPSKGLRGSKRLGVSREKKKEIINESVRRLASPMKNTKTATEFYNDDDLVFSIKMSKEEYQ